MWRLLETDSQSDRSTSKFRDSSTHSENDRTRFGVSKIRSLNLLFFQFQGVPTNCIAISLPSTETQRMWVILGLYKLNMLIKPNSIIRLTELKVDGKKTKISKEILSQAVSLIILTNHANSVSLFDKNYILKLNELLQSMHVLSAPSIFSLALLTSTSIEKLKECYK